jgi:hypothetical protein
MSADICFLLYVFPFLAIPDDQLQIPFHKFPSRSFHLVDSLHERSKLGIPDGGRE